MDSLNFKSKSLFIILAIFSYFHIALEEARAMPYSEVKIECFDSDNGVNPGTAGYVTIKAQATYADLPPGVTPGSLIWSRIGSADSDSGSFDGAEVGATRERVRASGPGNTEITGYMYSIIAVYPDIGFDFSYNDTDSFLIEPLPNNSGIPYVTSGILSEQSCNTTSLDTILDPNGNAITVGNLVVAITSRMFGGAKKYVRATINTNLPRILNTSIHLGWSVNTTEQVVTDRFGLNDGMNFRTKINISELL